MSEWYGGMEPDAMIEVSKLNSFFNLIAKAVFNYFLNHFQSNLNEIVDNFHEMNLREDLLRGIIAFGFEKPSATQQRAIIPCIKGKINLAY